MQFHSIARSLLSLAAAAVWLVSPAAQMGVDWRDAPAYVALFAPAGHREAYRALTSPLSPAELAGRLDAALTLLKAPGAWSTRQPPPLDAFGRSGPYDRSRLARLYGAGRPTVVRGASDAGGVTESWLLVSPYPDPSLSRLEPGTLVLVLTVR